MRVPDAVTLLLLAWLVYKVYETFAPDRRKAGGTVRAQWTLRWLLYSWAAAFTVVLAEHIVVARTVPVWVAGAGVALLAARTALKHAAMRSLARHWSLHVELRGDQTLCRTGPYRRLRHPAYLANLLELLALCMIAGAPWGALYVASLHLGALLVRIRVEERALAAHFGAAFEEYRARTPMLLPWRVGPGAARRRRADGAAA